MLQLWWFAARFCLGSQWHCHCTASLGGFLGGDATCAFGSELPCALCCFWCCGQGRKWSRICPARLLLCLCSVQKPVPMLLEQGSLGWLSVSLGGCPAHALCTLTRTHLCYSRSLRDATGCYGPAWTPSSCMKKVVYV